MDATVADPVIGRLLDDRYTAQERLAVGGMATVYIAHDSRLDRLVALKVMHQNLIHDPDFVARFHREATAAARLNTPHAVSVLDRGIAPGPAGPVIYLVMELVRGKSLRTHLGARVRLSAPEAIEIIEPVMEALAAAHDSGIIHRDIKPENILLGDDGRVKVADFGLARPVAQPTQALTQGVVMGTVGYLSPEQVTDGSADTRSDVYAAGIVLFEILTGQLPHTGSTPMSVAYQSVHGDVPAPSTLVPGIPPELDDLVVRATARDPNRRPADGGALLAELRAILPYLPSLDGDYPSTGPFGADAADGAFPPSQTGRGVDGGTGYGYANQGAFASGGRRARRQASQRQSYRRYLPAAAAAAVALLVVIGFLLVRSGGESGGGASGGVAVPLVEGLAKADAERDLLDAGLKVEYAEPEPSDTVEENHVIDQNPGQGVEVSANTVVTLTLSSGLPLVQVPNVEGLTETAAQTTLASAGFTVEKVEREAHDELQAGQAIRTEPPHTEKLRPGTKVTLVVSSGLNMVTVPTDLEGKTYAEAERQLTAVGLTPNRQDVPHDADQGDVVGVDRAGDQVPHGTQITVYVSNGGGGDDRSRFTSVPDVKGLDLWDAQDKLRAAGLNSQANGLFGKVERQSPSPGERVRRGTTVRLILRD